jgi:ribose transport system permease protein
MDENDGARKAEIKVDMEGASPVRSNGKSQPRNIVRRIFSKKISGVFTALVFLTVLSSLFSEHFLSTYNITIIIRNLAFIGLVALGQTMVLLTGEIDISVGAVAGLAAVASGILMVDFHFPPIPTVFIGLFLGCLCGALNGVLVTQLRLNALVVTLGTMGIFSGLNLVVTKGKAITGIPNQIYFLGQGVLFGLPMPLVIMLLMMGLLSFIANKTAFGRHLYAIGSNVEAAKLVGIRVDIIKISAFVMASLLSAAAGILMVARLGSAQPAIGQIWLLPSIAAAVIGGTALTGGEGTPAGTIIGAAIIGVIENIIILVGVSPYWQTVVSGAVVVIAISIDSIQRMLVVEK